MITKGWAGNKDWNDPSHGSVHPDNDADNDDDDNNDDDVDDDYVDLFAKVTATASDPRTSAGERTGWHKIYIFWNINGQPVWNATIVST